MTNHLKEMYRGNKSRGGAVHEKEHQATNKNHIDTVTINSFRSSSK